MGRQKQIFTAASRLSYNRMALNYFTCCEIFKEDGNNLEERELFEAFNGLMERFLEGTLTEEAAAALREDLISQMRHITYYAVIFQVYEYVMNRLEPRFIPLNIPELDTPEKRSQWVRQYLFQENGLETLNERVHNAFSQLPVRLTNSRFFTLMRQGMSAYQGGSQADFDSALEYFRIEALLQPQLEQWERHTEIREIFCRLRGADYRNMDEAAFRAISSDLEDAGMLLNQISGQNVLLMDLVNDLYALVLALPEISLNAGESALFHSVLSRSLQLFRDEAAEREVMDREAETLFVPLEGGQEAAFAQWDSLLDEAEGDEFSAGLTEDQRRKLKMLRPLLSSSTFAPLKGEEGASDASVSEEEWEEKVSCLEQDLTASWKGQPRRVVRGIMAGLLAELPLVFTSLDEMDAYFLGSLESCSDEGEAMMSVKLLKELDELDELDDDHEDWKGGWL